MYISIYDSKLKHLTNITNVSLDLTERVFDFDTLNADGGYDLTPLNDLKLMIVNEDDGTYVYSCLIDNLTEENNAVSIKGFDFKKLISTEILVDYTNNPFTGNLYGIFDYIIKLVLFSGDETFNRIPIHYIIDIGLNDINIKEMFGDLSNQYFITNAYDFLLVYMRYYNIVIETKFDIVYNRIILSIRLTDTTQKVEIKLKDFEHTLTTTTQSVNKTIATLQYKPEVEKDDQGNELPAPPRPTTIAMLYYYLTTDNQIVQSDYKGTGISASKRHYPVYQKVFEAEFLAQAQLEAVYELAVNRYMDNIELDNNVLIDPIDLKSLRLYDIISLFSESEFYKDLPVTEKKYIVNSKGKNTIIKLGFKKILLTEIIKIDTEKSGSKLKRGGRR